MRTSTSLLIAGMAAAAIATAAVVKLRLMEEEFDHNQLDEDLKEHLAELEERIRQVELKSS